MERVKPATGREMAGCLREAASQGKQILLEGHGSKMRAGGPVADADVCISTAALDQVLEYEPRDLTVSVSAGLPWVRLVDMLAKDGYMTPLDPPFSSEATVGGVIAANSSGPRRRMYGTARDLVIGMKFATLDGKVVTSGGMVVKNVAGLDMAKVMIGSLGTLAAIVSVNFKLIPRPGGTRTFLFEHDSAAEAIARRDRVLRSVLQPAAIDLLSPPVAAEARRNGWVLAIAAAGNAPVLERYAREFSGAEMLDAEPEREFWSFVEEYPARFLAAHPAGAVVRVSMTLAALGECLANMRGRAIARAGNGVCYSFLEEAARADQAYRLGRAVMEYGPVDRQGLSMWPEIDSGFPMMQKIKEMFDPKNLLNRGRLYGRL